MSHQVAEESVPSEAEETTATTPQPTESLLLCFGHALEAVKNGACATRLGWGSADPVQIIYLNEGSASNEVRESMPARGLRTEFFNLAPEETVVRLPNINLRTSLGEFLCGWTPSQEDMLTDDWCIVLPSAPDSAV